MDGQLVAKQLEHPLHSARRGCGAGEPLWPAQRAAQLPEGLVIQRGPVVQLEIHGVARPVACAQSCSQPSADLSVSRRCHASD